MSGKHAVMFQPVNNTITVLASVWQFEAYWYKIARASSANPYGNHLDGDVENHPQIAEKVNIV